MMRSVVGNWDQKKVRCSPHHLASRRSENSRFVLELHNDCFTLLERECKPALA